MTQAVATPTQVTHPWRAAIRTAVAYAVATLLTGVAVALAPRLGLHVSAGEATGATGVVGAIVTRVLAVRAVDAWVTRWLPWLAAVATPVVRAIEDAMTQDTPVPDTPAPDTVASAVAQDGAASAG